MPQNPGSVTNIANTKNYTSPWANTDFMDSISGSCFADKALTLYVEQSGDGTNTDISASHAVTANTIMNYTESLILPYHRLRVTNTSGDDTTALRLCARYKRGENP